MDSKKIAAAEARVRSAFSDLLAPEHVGFCITMVVGVPGNLVLLRMGADVRSPLAPPDDEAWGHPAVALIRGREGSIILEPRGRQGADPEFLETITVGGAAGSILYDEDRATTLSLAQGQKVEFHEKITGRPTVGLALENLFAELDFENAFACAILVVERFTGERVKAQAGPATRYPVRPESAIPGTST